MKKGDVTILWDLPIITDRTIMANKPDVVVLSHRDKKCLLIEVSIPEDRNVLMKEIEKIHKYRDLEIEVSRMWRVKAKTVPVVVGALGVVSQGFRKNIEILPGGPSAVEVQKIAVLGTAHLLRKVLG